MKSKEYWNQKLLPIKFNDKINDLLHSGIIYIHGRDSFFRPIIILSPYKINIKNDIDILLEGITFLLEFVLNFIMLPGQIENWIIIVDLNKMGLFNLPLNVKIIILLKFIIRI